MTKKNVYYLIDQLPVNDEAERFPEFTRSKIKIPADLVDLNAISNTRLGKKEEEK